MKPAKLWEIALLVAPEAEDAATALLENVFNLPPAAYTDLVMGSCRISAFIDRREDWNSLKSQRLTAGLKRIRESGLAIGPGEISFKEIRAVDWAESWKRHFKPIAIGASLLIKPSWSRRQPQRGQAVVILDPGLSFGTGQHPTTLFCLSQLARRRRRGVAQSFLDIGTGSGILAIAAAKLGYSPVRAFDFDPEAIRAARANVNSNSVAALVSLRRADLTRLPARSAARFDVICANLIFDLLLAEADKIIKRLKPEGTLVLAGILVSQFDRVRERFEQSGLRLVAHRIQKEWRSGAFRFVR